MPCGGPSTLEGMQGASPPHPPGFVALRLPGWVPQRLRAKRELVTTKTEVSRRGSNPVAPTILTRLNRERLHDIGSPDRTDLPGIAGPS